MANINLQQSGGGSGGGGGVTSLTGDSVVYNNAASTGVVTLSIISQVANKFFAGPASGGSVAPTWRSMVIADLPTAIPNANLANASITINGDGALLSSPGATALGGTAAFSLSSQLQNRVLISPNGSSGAPTFRALLVADLPTSIPNANLANSSITINGDGSLLSSPGATALGATAALTLNTQAKNLVLAGPATGANAAPTFRTLVTADLPVSGTPGAIVFGQTASGQTASNFPEQTLTLTVNKGDCVVVAIVNATTQSAAGIVVDDGGNSYSLALAQQTTASVGQIFIYVCINAWNSATKVTSRLPSNPGSNMAMAAATYTGVKSIGVRTNNNSGAVTAGTITASMTVANSYMVTVFSWFKSASAITVSANTGTIRTNTSATTTLTGIALVDNTQAGTGNETCAVTASLAPAGWATVAIELVHS